MMVANSFDLWQKDSFFSAAEEVQESADVMESAYRMWIREKGEGSKPEYFNELSRELQTTLGTAKWQLEEFERAVRMSHGHRSDDITASRHKQFVAAIESQISRVEAALREAFSEEGSQPLRWVNLDEEERDDLAIFLSGTSECPVIVKDECSAPRPSMKSLVRNDNQGRKDADCKLDTAFSTNISDKEGLTDVVSSSNRSSDFIIDIDEKESPGRKDNVICQADKTNGSRRTWSSPNFGALRIVIADEDEQRKNLLPSCDGSPKEKGSKYLPWKQRFGEHLRTKGTSNLVNQVRRLWRKYFGTRKAPWSGWWPPKAIANSIRPSVQLLHPTHTCVNAVYFFNCSISTLFNLIGSGILFHFEIEGAKAIVIWREPSKYENRIICQLLLAFIVRGPLFDAGIQLAKAK